MARMKTDWVGRFCRKCKRPFKHAADVKKPVCPFCGRKFGLIRRWLG